MKLSNKAELRNVYSMITNSNSLTLSVESYQRPYKWPAVKIAQLFEDYEENIKHSPKDLDYFLGAIVLVDADYSTSEKPASNYDFRYQIVDGQQRLTTVFLMNYVKYLLLIQKADVLIGGKSMDLAIILKEIDACYYGFIGANNGDRIVKANDAIKNAVQEAIKANSMVDVSKRNEWRRSIGWIENPNISPEARLDYVNNCKESMKSFLEDEVLRLKYANPDYNEDLKEALSNVVLVAGETCSPIIEVDEKYKYDLNDEEVCERPFVARANNIFMLIEKREKEMFKGSSGYEIICNMIDIINEMLVHLKLCMICTEESDDAFQLFESLNDRSEAVSDLELIKDNFFRIYYNTCNDTKLKKSQNLALLDDFWNKKIYDDNNIKDVISYCSAVFFTGKTDLRQNDKRRSSFKAYLSGYSKELDGTGNPYKFVQISNDFQIMAYIQTILKKIFAFKKVSSSKLLSLYVENCSGSTESSIVARALALSLNLDYLAVTAGIVCDIVGFYYQAAIEGSFDEYLELVFSENECKNNYFGLWQDCCILWKALIMGDDYKPAKKLSDKLVALSNTNTLNISRIANEFYISFSSADSDKDVSESTLKESFNTWLGDWSFFQSGGQKKLKIKNLFVHLHNRYLKLNNQLVLRTQSSDTYKEGAIELDLDHLDARTPVEGSESDFFCYNNLANRVKYTNALGNMMPLAMKINRGKHNTSLEKTLEFYSANGYEPWIVTETRELFNTDSFYTTTSDGKKIPTAEFFDTRKEKLINYFVKIVDNQKQDAETHLNI